MSDIGTLSALAVSVNSTASPKWLPPMKTSGSRSRNVGWRDDDTLLGSQPEGTIVQLDVPEGIERARIAAPPKQIAADTPLATTSGTGNQPAG